MSTSALPFNGLPGGASSLTFITAGNPSGSLLVKTAKPSGAGVLDRNLGPMPYVPNWVELLFAGQGANDTTFTIVWAGWRQFASSWVFRKLGKWTATLCTLGTEADGSVGTSSTDFPASTRFVDTLALDAAYTALEGVAFRTVSPADNTPAALLLDATGYPISQLHITLGTATGAGALRADLDG